MSKRYGRNQKRKAREQIRSLESKNENLKTTIKELEGLTYHAKMIVKTVREVCPNSIVFQNPNVIQSHMRKIPIYNDLDCSFAINDEPCFQDFNLNEVSLYDLETDCRTNEFQSCIHFLVEFDGSNAGYRLTRSAFEAMPDEYLAGNIANQMLSHIRRNRSNGNNRNMR